jgi:Raf kinase inhibitor-like YbhB/YbcL family protein
MAAAEPPAGEPASSSVSSFVLSSAEIAPGETIRDEQVFNGFGCSGKNISPSLAWNGAPQGTKSFAVLVHDPDAPTGSGWWHWVVFNIPADVRTIPLGAGSAEGTGLPAGAVQGVTDFGSIGYGGPCPPPGPAHRYYFRLHALKIDKIEVPENASPALISFNVNANTIAQAELLGTYRR